MIKEIEAASLSSKTDKGSMLHVNGMNDGDGDKVRGVVREWQGGDSVVAILGTLLIEFIHVCHMCTHM